MALVKKSNNYFFDAKDKDSFTMEDKIKLKGMVETLFQVYQEIEENGGIIENIYNVVIGNIFKLDIPRTRQEAKEYLVPTFNKSIEKFLPYYSHGHQIVKNYIIMTENVVKTLDYILHKDIINKIIMDYIQRPLWFNDELNNLLK